MESESEIIAKLTDMLRKYADVGGAAYGVLSDPFADGRDLSDAWAFMGERISNWTVPNAEILWRYLVAGPFRKGYVPGEEAGEGYSPAYRNPLWAGIGLWALSRLGRGVLPGTDIMRDVGQGLVAGTLGGALIWLGALGNPDYTGEYATPCPGPASPTKSPKSPKSPGGTNPYYGESL